MSDSTIATGKPGSRPNVFDEPVSETEKLAANWARKSAECRAKLDVWESVPNIVQQKRREYVQWRRYERDALRRLRNSRRGLWRAGGSRWLGAMLTWSHPAVIWYSMRILISALLIVLHGLTKLVLYVLIPPAALVAAVRLVELVYWLFLWAYWSI